MTVFVPAVRSRCNGDQARPGGRMSMCHVSCFEAQDSQHHKREGHKLFLLRDRLSRTSVPL